MVIDHGDIEIQSNVLAAMEESRQQHEVVAS